MSAHADPTSIFPPQPACKYDDVLNKSRKESWDSITRKNFEKGGDEKLDWKFHSKEKDVEIWVRPDPNSYIQQTKGVGIINCPVGVAAQLAAINWDIRKKWDTQADTNKVLEIIDSTTDICHSTFTAPWPVSPRDFVFISRVEYLTGGRLWTWCTSVPHKDAPEKSSHVRGTFFFSAMLFEPLEGNTKAKCTYTLASNPGGSLPTFLVNSATTSNPLAIDNCRKELKDPKFVERTQAVVRKEAEERVRQQFPAADKATTVAAIVDTVVRFATPGDISGVTFTAPSS